jgi:spermidine synthase
VGRLPLLLYGLTGFSGLLAEQGFEKYTSLLVGATASASAAVLFTYFLGFALGSIAAGRLVHSGRIRRPMLAYGLLELLIGLSCVAFSYSFHSLMENMAPAQNLFESAALKLQVRFLCGCLLVLPTAVLMGASFPLIASALDCGNGPGERRWVNAYSSNLAGAFAAALAAPIAILPAIGLRGAMWLCFGIGAAVCGVALQGRQPLAALRQGAGEQPRRTERAIRLLLVASFASGAVFFALEVIWTHLIGVVIGASIYAFSWMLVGVLLGLLTGSSMTGRLARSGRPMSMATLFQCCTLCLALQFLLWDRSAAFFVITPPARLQDSFYFAECFKLAVTLVLLLPSSTLLGLIYPRLLASPLLRGQTNSKLAGYLNGANALGCLCGALLGVFVLIPLLGSEASLKLIIVALATFWLLFLRREAPSPARWRRAIVAATVIGVWITASHWDWRLLTAGRANYFGRKPPAAVSGAAARVLPPALVFRHEDVQGGLTTVVEQQIETGQMRRTVRTMFTNGKFQGDDNPLGENNAQFGFAAIPSLFVNRHERALLIGLGTGHTAAALDRLGYRQIDVAEFAPGIVEAADRCFRDLNERVLSNPRVKIYLEDGRNVLLTRPRQTYDLITIEITSIWFAGATNLYSREFYELARKRLNPGGVLQQWVQLHHISPREIASNLATARAVFPYVSLWYYGHQGMLLASDRPFDRASDVAERLQASGLSLDAAGKLVQDLAKAQLVSAGGVTRLAREWNPRINSDHNRWIEYATPQYQSSSFDWVALNLAFVGKYK